jgi:predicted nucleotidyltransferase
LRNVKLFKPLDFLLFMSQDKEQNKKPKGLTGNLGSDKGYKPLSGNIGMPGMANMASMGGMNSMTSLGGSMPSISSMPKKKTPEEIQKEFEDLKKKLESFKKNVLKKYKFTRFLSVLPGSMLPFFAEDEGMPVNIEKTNPKLLMMCIPEDHFKEMEKIRADVVSMLKQTKENVWLVIKTEVDLWNYGLDSKFDLMDGVGASFPLYDNGFLGVVRLANIHKSLVLRKFEKYVASYAIYGSIVRGVAGKDSDVDTVVIIDDTDVKRMPRLELLEKLRGLLSDYIREATALSGVKNPLNVQVWLLTDFWDRVKNAEPVAFTFIRDGIPMYDRGTFIPWKLLLRMGKIKPSPESVDMFMKSGEQTKDLLKRRMLDAMVDVYWGIVTPTQALMMLAGQGVPEPKAIVSEVKKILVDKEKLMSQSDLKTLEKVVKYYKDYEHGKLNNISGAEIDELKKDGEVYVKKMKSLREKIEARMQEHEAEKIFEETLDLLKNIFGNKGQSELLKNLENDLVKKGKIKKRILGIAKELLNVKQKIKGKKKLTQQEMHRISAESVELSDALTEYAQRKELVAIQKSTILIKHKEGNAELMITDGSVFLVDRGKISKIVGKKLVKSSEDDLREASKKAKDNLKVSLSSEVLDVLKKEFGEFEIEF